MEPIIIYTDAVGVDVGAIQSFSLDMAFGADEQDYALTCSGVEIPGGAYVYIDGTEYGGIVDMWTQSTTSDAITYSGRTWHGMLAGKVVKPPSGYDYYTATGDANAAIRDLLTYVGLTGVLTGRATSAGFSVSYQFDRFCNAYEGMLKMLQDVGAVLMIQRHDGITELWAEKAATIEDEADSDLMDFSVTKQHRTVNHLVCAGEGELQDRVIVDLYADGSGNVSTSQTFTGEDEIALYYNYSGANAAELATEGAKKLKEYQTNGGADIDRVGVGDWHVGNVLQMRDNRTGTVVNAMIAKKIIKVELGVLTVDYEIGDHIAAQAATFDASLNGIAEQPVPLSASVLDDYAKLTDLEHYSDLYRGTLIPANSDLNTYTTVGTYYRTSLNGEVATLSNCPVTYAFKMTVERTISDNYIKQRITDYQGSAAEWTRYTPDNGATWYDWWRNAPRSNETATANTFLATPNGSAGLPSYRAIANADLPTVNASHGGTGETTLQNSANALVNALATGDNAAFGDGDAYVLTENADGTHGTWYRRPIRNILTWVLNKLKPTAYDVSSLITQTTAQAGNFTISAADISVSGCVVMLDISFTVAAALTANTEYSLCSLGSAIRPVQRANANVTDLLWGGTIVTGGTCYVRPNAAVSASTTTRHLQATYLTASAYNG